MNPIHILEFNPGGPGIFCRYLEFLAKEQSWDFKFETRSEFDASHLPAATIVKVDMSMSAAVLSHCPIQPALVRTLQAVDFLVKESGTWYPRSFLYEAVRKNVIDHARDLDIRKTALVVGTGHEAITVLAILVNLGFRQIVNVGYDTTELGLVNEWLCRNYFGINLTSVLTSDLMVQSLGAEICINTLNLELDEELLRSLSYFNFLKSQGFLLDLNFSPSLKLTPLMEEAEKAALQVIPPLEIMAYQSYFFVKQLGLMGTLKFADFSESWNKFLTI